MPAAVGTTVKTVFPTARENEVNTVKKDRKVVTRTGHSREVKGCRLNRIYRLFNSPNVLRSIDVRNRDCKKCLDQDIYWQGPSISVRLELGVGPGRMPAG